MRYKLDIFTKKYMINFSLIRYFQYLKYLKGYI